MIELHPEREYAIDNATVAAGAGVPESQVEAYYLLNPMAMAGGRMAIGAHMWFKPKRSLERGSETFQIDLDASGGVGFRDLDRHFPPRHGVGGPQSHHVPAPFGDATLYLTGTDHALLVPASPQAEPYAIEIEQPLGVARYYEDKVDSLSPGYAVRLVSEGHVVAIPLQAASSTRWLAFLSVDLGKRKASWFAFPASAQPSGGGALLKRLFGAGPVLPKAPTGSDLLQLSAEDFPHGRGSERYRPHINQALQRAGRVYIYTKGHSDSPKYGYPCSGIAEIGPDGRVKSLPFMRDYTRTGDEKKYGIEGRFTSSGRYCILTSVYKTTDPWKGQRKLFDMDSGELVDVKLPRGFSKYQLIDHAGDHFWAELWPVARGETNRVVRFGTR